VVMPWTRAGRTDGQTVVQVKKLTQNLRKGQKKQWFEDLE
jgi:hypothetical protein